jgi:putative membrane protein
MPRLFIYLTEASDKPELEKSILTKQLMMMASRLWFGITWPSAIITLGMGTALIVNQPQWLEQDFMILKLVLVFFLYAYHLSLHYVFNLLKKGHIRYTSQQLRFWNEVATLFLISIVFLIVLKSAFSMVWGVVGLLIITILILLGIRFYKKFRN